MLVRLLVGALDGEAFAQHWCTPLPVLLVNIDCQEGCSTLLFKAAPAQLLHLEFNVQAISSQDVLLLLRNLVSAMALEWIMAGSGALSV